MRQEDTLGRALAKTDTDIDFSGTWVNDLKSEAILQQNKNVLTGTYVSVSRSGARAIGDLQGYVTGDLISFVVRWRAAQAITTWVGQLEPLAPVQTLKTIWLMTKQVVPGEEWGSINTGSDSFVRK